MAEKTDKNGFSTSVAEYEQEVIKFFEDSVVFPPVQKLIKEVSEETENLAEESEENKLNQGNTT